MDANEHELLIATANHANDADERIVGSLSSFSVSWVSRFRNLIRKPGIQKWNDRARPLGVLILQQLSRMVRMKFN